MHVTNVAQLAHHSLGFLPNSSIMFQFRSALGKRFRHGCNYFQNFRTQIPVQTIAGLFVVLLSIVSCSFGSPPDNYNDGNYGGNYYGCGVCGYIYSPVCGRLQIGQQTLYRTFSSPCVLRQEVCLNPDERKSLSYC